MDPALREYLDKMQADLAARCDKAVVNTNVLMANQEGLVKQLEEITVWKPDLEDRLAKLQDVVANLQRARPDSPGDSGGSASD